MEELRCRFGHFIGERDGQSIYIRAWAHIQKDPAGVDGRIWVPGRPKQPRRAGGEKSDARDSVYWGAINQLDYMLAGQEVGATAQCIVNGIRFTGTRGQHGSVSTDAFDEEPTLPALGSLSVIPIPCTLRCPHRDRYGSCKSLVTVE